MNEETKVPLILLDASFQSFVDKLRKERDSLKPADASEFNREEFFRHLGALSDSISHECTKMCMIFTDEATPSVKACQTLCDRLIGMGATLAKTTTGLSRDNVGNYLRQAIYDSVMEVLGSVSALAVATKEGRSNTKEQLKGTGTVWEVCDQLKAVPKDSRQLLLRNLENAHNLVNDAFTEIQEMNDDQSCSGSHKDNGTIDQDSPSLSECQKSQLTACLQLIKAAKACLKKICGAVQEYKWSMNSANVDDQLTALVERISPAVDNVVSAFYEDTQPEELLDEVTKLDTILKDLLLLFKTTSYYQPDPHGKWMDILCKAIQHNFTKFRDAANCLSK